MTAINSPQKRTLIMLKVLLAAAILGLGMWLASHIPPSAADHEAVQQANPGAITPIPAAAYGPMIVNGSSFTRAGSQQWWSVYCVPPGTPDLASAVHWREVQVTENGPDGPDGYWKHGRPCPDGKVLAGG